MHKQTHKLKTREDPDLLEGDTRHREKAHMHTPGGKEYDPHAQSR